MTEISRKHSWWPLAAVLIVLIGLVVGVRMLLAWSPEPTPRAAPAQGTAAPAPEMVPPPAGEAQGEPATRPLRPATVVPEPAQDEPPLVGVHVFPPPGTRPLVAGIIVPEDFELPPGYVRHSQTTDAGERLPDVLMFHPRRPPVDAEGNPIPVPADRVVPPELAPEGLPIQILVPPDQSRQPTGLSRFVD